MNSQKYFALVGFLFLFSVLAMPGVQAGHLISNPMAVTFDLEPTGETDVITLTTDNNYDVDMQFIALNPANNPMPISSVIGFNTRIETNDDGFKWSYDLNLPNSNFVAKVKITSPIPVTILENKYVVVDGVLISFDDVLDYDYEFSLNQIDQYSVEYIITKDYSAHGININDAIVIDPSITTYPDNDGYLRRNNVGVIDTFLTTTYLRVGVIDGSPDSNDFVTRTFMKFDTEQIEFYDDIINATLKVYLDTKTQTGGQTCNAVLESIDDYEDLGALDWDATGTTINSSFVLHTDPTDVFYEQDVSNYIEKEGITAFRIKGSYETYNANSCRFGFASNETINSPQLEIYWNEGEEIEISETIPNFNVTDDNSKQVFPEQSCGFLLPSTAPYDPKIACETDGDSCVAIFYDHETLCSRGLKYSLSYNGFETIAYHGMVTGWTWGQSQYLDPMIERGSELPYDIVWDDNTNMYYIVIGSKVYVIPAYDPEVYGVTPYRVTDGFAIAGGGTAGADLSVNCATEVNWKGGGYSCTLQAYNPIRFNSDDATELFMIYSCQIYKSAIPYDWDGATWFVTYDVTNTTQTANGNLYDCTELDSTQSCSAGSNFGWDYYSGYAELGSIWRYNIEGQIDYCTGTTDRAIEEDNFGSPNDDFNHFYFGGNLFWRNETTYQIVSSESADLTSYGTPSFIYKEDETIAEIINQSDADNSGNANYYIWYRSSSLIDGSDGIWVQKETTYPVIVSSSKDVFVTLSCDDAQYTTTGSGKIMQLYTPCLSGNEISFISSYSPQSKTLDLNFGSCDVVSYGLYYPNNPYDFTFTFKDALSNDNLENVEISITGEATETTNSNGQAVFNINAISNSNFKVKQTGCDYTLSTTGTPKTFYGEAELTGYVDYDFTMTPATLTQGDINIWKFTDNKLLTLYPTGVVIDAHVFTSDGEEITVDSYNVSVSGNNGLTYTFVNNKATLRNWNRNLPATFLLFDNRTTYNVTIDLEYPGGSDSQEKQVTLDNQYDVYFYLPYTFLDLPCTDIADCVDDFCDASGYHHQLSGCVNQRCEYFTTDCQTPDLCDNEDGCFTVGTDISCTSDNQCLYNTNVTQCIDEYSMYVGFCGDDGYCKQKEKVCTTFCNETVGYCNEKAQCIIPETIDVGFEWDGGASITHFVCTFENAGTDYCIQHGEISNAELQSLGKTIADVYFTHEGFKVTETATGYKISDVVLSCSDTCDMEITFCNSGECSAETNQCLNVAQSSDFGSMLWGGWLWIASIVPVELRMLAWLLFTVFLMIWYKQETGKHGKSNDQSTLVVGFICLIAGFTIGWLHWILLLILGIGVALIMAQKIGQ